MRTAPFLSRSIGQVIHLSSPSSASQHLCLIDRRYDGSHGDTPPERFQREKMVEERLLWKLDLRMTILLLIYILNCEYSCQAGAWYSREVNGYLVVDRNSTACVFFPVHPVG